MATHRTAMGKSLDMAVIRAKNEQVRALGNMNVNARGDIIDSNGNVIKDNNQRVANLHRQTTRSRVAPKPAASTVPMPKKIEADQRSASEIEFDDMDEPNPKKS